jgi:hypothetical protein
VPRPLASTQRRTRAETRRDQLRFRMDMYALFVPKPKRQTKAKARWDRLQLKINMALIPPGMTAPVSAAIIVPAYNQRTKAKVRRNQLKLASLNPPDGNIYSAYTSTLYSARRNGHKQSRFPRPPGAPH